MKRKLTFLVSALIVALFLFPPISFAHPGNTDSVGCHTCRTNCPSWGRYYGEYHCHTPKYNYPSTPTCPLHSRYDSLSETCKCNYGYITSGGKCIYADTYCQNLYGFHSRYDSLYENCECSYGYVYNLSGTKCISEDDACQEQFGFGSKATISGDKCECKFGYQWEGNKCIIDVQNYGTYDSYPTYTIEVTPTSTPLPTSIPTKTPIPKPTNTPIPSPTQAPEPTPEVKGEMTSVTPIPTEVKVESSEVSTETTLSGVSILSTLGVIGGAYWLFKRTRRTS